MDRGVSNREITHHDFGRRCAFIGDTPMEQIQRSGCHPLEAVKGSAMTTLVLAPVLIGPPEAVARI
jgi:hypothetical protein